MEQNKEYLTPEQVCERFLNSVTTDTLSNWRVQKKGPPYTKVGRQVLYPIKGIIEWEQKQTNTGEPK